MNESPQDPTRIQLEPSFVARLERLVGRVAAVRGRCEDSGRTTLLGGGDEFVGHRPYRPGDELRDLDWNLLARFDEPFVRVHRRGSGARWTILLDTSASMGLGRPGKLQRAAEVATGLAFVGLAEGARVELRVAPARRQGLNRRSELADWMRFVESLRAAGADGLAGLLRGAARGGAQRLFLVGDLFDVEPEQVAVLARRRDAKLDVVRLLAPRELEPGSADTDVEWVDPETHERLGVALDSEVRRRYEHVLTTHLERLRATCARHRVGHGVWSTARPFEDIVRGVLFQ